MYKFLTVLHTQHPSIPSTPHSVFHRNALALLCLLCCMALTSNPAMANDADEKLAVDFNPNSSQKQNSSVQQVAPNHDIFNSPLLQRYVLDELKAIRKDQLKHEAHIAKELASRELSASDRAITYTTDTVNNIFFIITAAATILVVAGVSSLRDVKAKVEEITESRTGKLAVEYEERLNEIEDELKAKSTEILHNQALIAESNQIHSLWMRAAIETNSREKIRIYDEILAMRNDDIEAMTYKADAAIELEEFEWALKLCNQAIELDLEFPLAYWQRACALTGLEEISEALHDIERAIDINPSLREQLLDEPAFVPLRDNEFFISLTNSDQHSGA